MGVFILVMVGMGLSERTGEFLSRIFRRPFPHKWPPLPETGQIFSFVSGGRDARGGAKLFPLFGDGPLPSLSILLGVIISLSIN
jgi:hypothetical protein